MDIILNMDKEITMRAFTTHDLNKQVGEVTDAATKSPVVITRHRKPRFVMMSYEHYERIKAANDPRRVYGPGETPADIAELFGPEIDRLAEGEGYDDEK
jgi:prevent-host-death family protein